MFKSGLNEFHLVEVPEGILVDFGSNPTDENAQRVYDEAAVNDVTEMRDLVIGYQNQNMFLNQEVLGRIFFSLCEKKIFFSEICISFLPFSFVLELQKIVQTLEDRERKITRQNFDIEACYYQLKSRYIMVLNHLRASKLESRGLIICVNNISLTS